MLQRPTTGFSPAPRKSYPRSTPDFTSLFWFTAFIHTNAGLIYTHGLNYNMGSIIHWLVQQNECWSLLKCWVPKFSNIISNSWAIHALRLTSILSTSLLICAQQCIFLWWWLQPIIFSVLIMFVGIFAYHVLTVFHQWVEFIQFYTHGGPWLHCQTCKHWYWHP